MEMIIFIISLLISILFNQISLTNHTYTSYNFEMLVMKDLVGSLTFLMYFKLEYVYEIYRIAIIIIFWK